MELAIDEQQILGVDLIAGQAVRSSRSRGDKDRWGQADDALILWWRQRDGGNAAETAEGGFLAIVETARLKKAFEVTGVPPTPSAIQGSQCKMQRALNAVPRW
jgi:hypothetical protein